MSPAQSSKHPAGKVAGRSPRRHEAFTLIELLVVVTIIALLISILLSSLAQARQQSKRTACGANLYQIGVAMTMYTNDSGWFPGDHLHREPNSIVTWPVRLMRYLGKQNEIFWCPAAPPDTHWNGHSRIVAFLYYAAPGEQATFAYGYNAWGVASFSDPQLGLGGHVLDHEANAWESSWNQGELRAGRVKRPADMIAVTDSDSDCTNSSPGSWDELACPMDYPNEPHRREWPGNRHNKRSNVLFVDTHVESALQEVLVKPTAGMRQKWNNDFREHCELWVDLPPGYNCPGS